METGSSQWWPFEKRGSRTMRSHSTREGLIFFGPSFPAGAGSGSDCPGINIMNGYIIYRILSNKRVPVLHQSTMMDVRRNGTIERQISTGALHIGTLPPDRDCNGNPL